MEKIKKLFNKIYRFLCFVQDFFAMAAGFCFGNEECLCCGKRSCSLPVCKKCINIHLIQELDFSARCSVCGKPLLGENDLCMECREAPIIQSASPVLPLYSYRLWKKNLLFEWKLSSKRNLSRVFAYLVHQVIKNHFKTVQPVLVPVPPRKGKIKHNGWDQIQELCKILKFAYGYIVINPLERLSTRQQKKLDREERVQNKGKSYKIKEKFDFKYKNRPHIVIDDVLTTGVTVETCCFILKNHGIKNVAVVSLFIVD